MVSPFYPLLLGAVALERGVELVVATRNARWSFARGGREVGKEHYPFMVALHAGLLLGCALEPSWTGHVAPPGVAVAATAIVLACQALRWWCIATLGPRWNTRVIVVPGLPRITGGPYRWANHPNYVAVVLEGIALPVAGGAYLTAALFTALDAWLLTVRVRCEDAALRVHAEGS